MPRPRCRLGRATPPSHTAVVHELSQRDTDAFIFGERCADLPRPRTRVAHSWPPNSRRATPPICPDLIYDRDRRALYSARHTFKGFIDDFRGLSERSRRIVMGHASAT